MLLSLKYDKIKNLGTCRYLKYYLKEAVESIVFPSTHRIRSCSSITISTNLNIAPWLFIKCCLRTKGTAGTYARHF